MKVSLGDLDLDRECRRNVRSKIVRERKALRDDCPLLNQVGLLLQMVKEKRLSSYRRMSLAVSDACYGFPSLRPFITDFSHELSSLPNLLPQYHLLISFC
jgi:hypothetical protein